MSRRTTVQKDDSYDKTGNRRHKFSSCGYTTNSFPVRVEK
jgi:hypothetical protein